MLIFSAETPIILTTTLKIITAIIIGSIVGLEREVINRPAGLRTHILVCVAACLIMDINILIMKQYSGANIDPTRMAAQVISGMGFLGAGTIIKEGATVKGLTTAASLWTIACLGLIIGAGYYSIALLGTFFIFMALKSFSRFEYHLATKKREHTLCITIDDDTSILGQITYILSSKKCRISKLNIEKVDAGYTITVRYILPAKLQNEALLIDLHALHSIQSINAL